MTELDANSAKPPETVEPRRVVTHGDDAPDSADPPDSASDPEFDTPDPASGVDALSDQPATDEGDAAPADIPDTPAGAGDTTAEDTAVTPAPALPVVPDPSHAAKPPPDSRDPPAPEDTVPGGVDADPATPPGLTAPELAPEAVEVAHTASPPDTAGASEPESDDTPRPTPSIWDAPDLAFAPLDPPAEGGEAAAMPIDPWAANLPPEQDEDASPAKAKSQTDLEPTPPPEPEPIAAPEPVELALFGKLAARGDFVARNVPRPLQRPLEDWLSRVMNGSREVLGDQWDRVYVTAPAWFFWIGAEAFEDACSFATNNLQGARVGVLTGVLVPSADRLGRRFPLVLLLAGARAAALPPPPIAAPDHRWYAGLAHSALAFRQQTDLGAVETALQSAPGPATPSGTAHVAAVPPGQPLWAQAGFGGLSEMWRDLGAADHALAAHVRSYWWTGGVAAGSARDAAGNPCAEGSGAQVISVSGLPDAEVFAFMLRCGAA